MESAIASVLRSYDETKARAAIVGQAPDVRSAMQHAIRFAPDDPDVYYAVIKHTSLMEHDTVPEDVSKWIMRWTVGMTDDTPHLWLAAMRVVDQRAFAPLTNDETMETAVRVVRHINTHEARMALVDVFNRLNNTLWVPHGQKAFYEALLDYANDREFVTAVFKAISPLHIQEGSEERLFKACVAVLTAYPVDDEETCGRAVACVKGVFYGRGKDEALLDAARRTRLYDVLKSGPEAFQRVLGF